MLLWLQQESGNAEQAAEQEGGRPGGMGMLHLLDADNMRAETRRKTDALLEHRMGQSLKSTYEKLQGKTIIGIDAFGLLLGVFFVLCSLLLGRVLGALIDRYLRPVLERTKSEYDNKVLAALQRPVGHFVLIWGLFLSFSFIELPANGNRIVWSLLTTWLIVNIGFILYRGMDFFLAWLTHKAEEREGDILDSQFIPMIRDSAKVIISLLVLLTCVQSWGGDITAVLTGVGIGGLALAFAAQDTVANVFGSFMIFMDRPFRRGDWISMAGVEGDVEEIGIRSTRIRCFDKTVVSIPNKLVTSENIQNFSARRQRRIMLEFGITYDSSPQQVRDAVEGIRRIISTHPGIDQESHIVRFTDFGDSALELLVYCFANTADWAQYLIIREDVMLQIMELFDDLGVDFAFPSQSVYLHDMGQDIPAELRSVRRHNRKPRPLDQATGPERRSRAENDMGIDSSDS